jgi:hypothetical protein
MTSSDEVLGKIATIIRDLAPTGDDRLDERLGTIATQDPKRLNGDMLTLIRILRCQRDEIAALRAELAEVRQTALGALARAGRAGEGTS